MVACAFSLALTRFLVYFSIVYAQGLGFSGPERMGASDDEICRIIAMEVAATVRATILEVFGSIMSVMINMFDERYVSVTEAIGATTIVTMRSHGDDSMKYR